MHHVNNCVVSLSIAKQKAKKNLEISFLATFLRLTKFGCVICWVKTQLAFFPCGKNSLKMVIFQMSEA